MTQIISSFGNKLLNIEEKASKKVSTIKQGLALSDTVMHWAEKFRPLSPESIKTKKLGKKIQDGLVIFDVRKKVSELYQRVVDWKTAPQNKKFAPAVAVIDQLSKSMSFASKVINAYGFEANKPGVPGIPDEVGPTSADHFKHFAVGLGVVSTAGQLGIEVNKWVEAPKEKKALATIGVVQKGAQFGSTAAKIIDFAEDYKFFDLTKSVAKKIKNVGTSFSMVGYTAKAIQEARTILHTQNPEKKSFAIFKFAASVVSLILDALKLVADIFVQYFPMLFLPWLALFASTIGLVVTLCSDFYTTLRRTQ